VNTFVTGRFHLISMVFFVYQLCLLSRQDLRHQTCLSISFKKKSVITWRSSKQLTFIELPQVHVGPLNEHVVWVLQLLHHLLDETNVVCIIYANQEIIQSLSVETGMSLTASTQCQTSGTRY